MKGKKITLCLFIDAFGWEVLRRHPQFLSDLIVDKRPLSTILGYSSACDPSIISGLLPSHHRHWSCFYYSPSTCPYKWVKWLRFLPSFITDNHRSRHLLSRLIKQLHRFTGYFQIYNVPFAYLPYFDYAEKWRIWGPQGLEKGETIFSHLAKNQIPYFVGDQEPGDQAQLNKVEALIKEQSIKFAYLLLGQLDALMHAVGTKDSGVDQLLQNYDKQIRHLLAVAAENYQEVVFYLFADHGMHNVQEAYNLQQEIESLGLAYGHDYAAVYDSTMGRFWYFNDRARSIIKDCLAKINKGRVLSDQELQDLGVYFPDHQFGETIFLMNPGVLIVPSYMGLHKIPGMHGYHPSDPDSAAMICSNRLLPEGLHSIEQIYQVMLGGAAP
jgi:predicted AlkP superfamily pyrophosphatase or phosphodiesterase